jgi:hypothetical protein
VDEIKRAADPRDPGNDMKPAEDSTCGFGEYHVHELPLLSLKSPAKHNGRTAFGCASLPGRQIRRGFLRLPPFAGGEFVG